MRGEGSGIAAIGAAQPVSAMTGDVDKSENLICAVAHVQNRIFAHISAEEVPWLPDLTVVAKKASSEQRFASVPDHRSAAQ
jgi:hypothetical protein